MSFGNLYLATVVLIIAFVAWVARMPARRDAFCLRYNGVVLALATMTVLFILYYVRNYEALLGSSPDLMRSAQYIMYTVLFVLVYQMDLSRRAIRNLFILILVSGAVQGLIGDMQWMTNPGFFVIGMMGQHNIFAAYMILVTLLAVGVAVETRSRAVRLACLVGAGITVCGLAFSFSRTGYIALAVSVLTFACLPIARLKRAAVPLAAIVAMALTAALVPDAVRDRLRDILETATGERVTLSFKFRLEIWRTAWTEFASNPIFGNATAGGLKDNFFVKAAVETGLLGLGAFVALIYLALRASWRNIKHPPEDAFMRGIMIGFLPAAVSSLVVFNLAGDFIAMHGYIGVFWIALALVLRYPAASR